ncbi:hypothetical protein D1P53_000469 [Cryptococcus gattii VGV]|nr:hypothetical protein D1P53_000469 [Cryptococcus gattii VGV]
MSDGSTSPREPANSVHATYQPQSKRPSPSQSVAMPTIPSFHQHFRQNTSNDDCGSSRTIISPAASSAGPLSPGIPSESFVFPIRSVFQGMVHSDSSNSMIDGHRQRNQDSFQRSISNNSKPLRSPAFSDARRFSTDAAEAFHDEPDANIQTIAQMLQQDKDTSRKGNGKHQSGAVTFFGKAERERSGSDGKKILGPFSPDASGHLGNLTTTDTNNDSQHRKQQGISESSRFEEGINGSLELSHESGQAVQQAAQTDLPTTVQRSSTLKGKIPKSGHMETSFPNYPHFPSEHSSGQRERRFSTVNKVNPPPHNSPSHLTDTSHPPNPELQHPLPQHNTQRQHLQAAEMNKRTSSHGSRTSLEVDESAGSLSSMGDSGASGFKGIIDGSGTTGTGDSASIGSAHASGSRGQGDERQPTRASLVAQHRQRRQTSRQDSVRSFIRSQAGTTNLQDPNAPTPSPMPSSSHLPGDGQDIAVSMEDSANNEKLREQQQEEEEAREDGKEENEQVGQPITAAEDAEDPDEPAVTMRFEHVATEEGHHIVAGREGKLRRCQDEPITTPGAVQGFGVLMVLEEDYETGNLEIRQVSENSTEILGLSPKYLFKLDCSTRLLSLDQETILRDTLEYLPESCGESNSVEDSGPSIFLLSGFGEPGSDVKEDGIVGEPEAELRSIPSSAGGRRKEWTCWVAAHRPEHRGWNKVDEKEEPLPPPDWIILEFELKRDVYNPLVHPSENAKISTATADSTSQSLNPESTAASASASGPNRNTNTLSAGTRSGERALDSLASTVSGDRAGVPAGLGSDAASSDASPPDSGSSASDLTSVPKQEERMGLDGLEMHIPLEKILQSTTNHATPLRALERMRGTANHASNETRRERGRGRGGRQGPIRRKSGGTGAMDIFAVLGQVNDQLGSAPDLDTFLKVAVGLMQDICRFHRVLIYQFDEQMNGLVVSELVEWGKTTDLYMGLRFPATDIPPQARELYKINKVRMLYDRSQTTARIVLRNKEDLDQQLDMTHCYLRAMSPIHLKYLGNMGVRSSMSVSIMAFGQLWGLIACHSYGQHGMRVSFPVRQMLRILSDSISRNIERLSYAQRLRTRKLISTIPDRSHPTGYIISNAGDLLQIFGADAGLLVIGDGCKLLGRTEQGQAMLAIAEYLRIMRFDNLKASSCIKRDFPDLILPRASDTIAGLLYVPLTAKAGQDFIVFLRKGQVREVQWAGKPYKDDKASEEASLEPRKSFKAWTETVTGCSRSWTDDELESAGVLALIYGKFIHVWREKQTAMASNQLTAILLSNTSHAVRTPLSQIINTLELALAGNIDGDVRKMLENSHQASRALLFHVHDLLDLTRIETGNETAFNDPFDIRQSISDAVRLYQTELARRGLEFRVNMAEDLPQYVIGDSRKIKTVVSNLVANSVKFTEKGFIEVYCGIHRAADGGSSQASVGESKEGNTVTIEIVISDSGCGIPTVQLEEMFVTLEGAEPLQKDTGVGLGLAVVARIVEQFEGQLRAESEVGVGTKFYFSVPMIAHQTGRPSSRQSSHNSRNTNSSQLRTRTGSSGSKSESVVSLRSDGSGVPEIVSFVQDFSSSHLPALVGDDDQRLLEAQERMSKPGTFPVTDSSYPIRATKINIEDQHVKSAKPKKLRFTAIGSLKCSDSTTTSKASSASQSSAFSRPSSSSGQGPKRNKKGPNGETVMRVMVVEDDPINSQILQKRLKMDKHAVIAVTNGQEAVDLLEKDRDIDAILMDIQMPIMDGRTSAKEIRKLEARTPHPDNIEPFKVDGRTPIFAVSASLYEDDRANLAENFDGWLLKPLDFSRVRAILEGLENSDKRAAEVYRQGNWERGGYLKGEPRFQKTSSQSH